MTIADVRSPITSTGAPRSRRVRSALVAVGLLALVALPPFVLGTYWLFIATQLLAYGIATLGLHILFGRTGQLSLAHASFMGVGAYTTLVLAQRDVDPLVQLLAVVGVGLVAGALVPYPRSVFRVCGSAW
ncbi:membrane hypothetical protein [Aeromicrobium sp. 9AM]|nr:membrane hypothetical protein [Aeromicrobium sp. 9AM]